jgi:hypothetical protein
MLGFAVRIEIRILDSPAKILIRILGVPAKVQIRYVSSTYKMIIAWDSLLMKLKSVYLKSAVGDIINNGGYEYCEPYVICNSIFFLFF